MYAVHDRSQYDQFSGLQETESAPWSGAATLPLQLFCENEEPPFPALDSEILNGQFRAWRGQSGRRHIFSVYQPQNCPAYCYAILIAAAIDAAGKRRVFFIGDTGTFPEPVIQRARQAASNLTDAVEFHIHLLTQTQSERDAVADDIWMEAKTYRS